MPVVKWATPSDATKDGFRDDVLTKDINEALRVTTVGSSSSLTSPAPSAGSGTATNARVAASITSVTVLAANANRRGGYIHNDSTSICYLFFGATAAYPATYTLKLAADATYEFGVNVYPGRVDGIWVTATGAAEVTEY